MFGKALDGALEIVGGLLLWVLDPAYISSVAHLLVQHELTEDPTDWIAQLLVRSVGDLVGSANTRIFGAVFLLWHGAVKVTLVWALLRRQGWAYPAAILAFAAFIAYQIYRYTHTHSVWLIALSLLDMCVIVLTWLEYQRLRRSGQFRAYRPPTSIS